MGTKFQVKNVIRRSHNLTIIDLDKVSSFFTANELPPRPSLINIIPPPFSNGSIEENKQEHSQEELSRRARTLLGALSRRSQEP